jgi:hypothetical protein
MTELIKSNELSDYFVQKQLQVVLISDVKIQTKNPIFPFTFQNIAEFTTGQEALVLMHEWIIREFTWCKDQSTILLNDLHCDRERLKFSFYTDDTRTAHESSNPDGGLQCGPNASEEMKRKVEESNSKNYKAINGEIHSLYFTVVSPDVTASPKEYENIHNVPYNICCYRVMEVDNPQ